MEDPDYYANLAEDYARRSATYDDPIEVQRAQVYATLAVAASAEKWALHPNDLYNSISSALTTIS